MDTSKVIENIHLYRNNPTAIIRYILQHIRDVSDGKYNVPDATNTFAYIIETIAASANAVMVEDESLTRLMYSSLAKTDSEIYNHLSDRNMNNVFSTPSRAKFKIVINANEIINDSGAVDTGISGIRRITIPRDTRINIGSLVFTLQYPIDIRVKPHNGISVVYDTEILNPYKILKTNVLDSRIVKYKGEEFLEIVVDALQYSIKEITEPLSISSGYNKNISFADDFFSARAYHYLNNEWVELKTTHSDLVYDPTIATVLFKVQTQSLSIKIPPIYFSSGLIGSQIKILIHTTLGDINTDIESRSGHDIVVNYYDHLENTLPKYKAPLSSLRQIYYVPTGRTTGGRDKLNFKELKKLTVSNSFDVNDLPITKHQLSAKMNNLGYDIVKIVDNITSRIYVATRKLPSAGDLLTTGSNSQVMETSIGATVGLLYTDIDTLLLNNTITGTGKRLTITPKTLYSLDNGILSIVPDVVRESIESANVGDMTNAVNENNFLYSPFYYVLDYAYNDFSVRSYHLKPVVTGRVFLDENDYIAADIVTKEISFDITDTGIDVYVITSSKSTIDDVGIENIEVQLAYTPFNEVNRAFTSATYIGNDTDNNHIFKFTLLSDFDLDENNNLYFKSFKIIDSVSDRFTPTKLETDFDIMYIVKGVTLDDNSLNSYMAYFMLPQDTVEAYVAVREGFRVRLGHYLDNIWDKSRTVKNTTMYARYETDILNYWDNDIYEINPNTGARVVVGGNFVLLHAAGDPVLDIDLNHEVKYKRGALILDSDGNPVLSGDNRLERELRFILLDAKYRYANEDISVLYRDSIVDEMVRWINDDIDSIQKRLLEETEILFHPKKTFGTVNIYDEDGELQTISSEQRLSVILTVPKRVSIDSDLKAVMNKTVVETITSVLARRTITMSDMTFELKNALSDDVYGITVSGFGGLTEYTTVTMEDESQILSLAKELYVTSNGSVGIKNDITVSYIQHTD